MERRQGKVPVSDFNISQLNVLIVEDNLHFHTLIRTILQALGVECVEEARDGAEAFEVLSSFDADLAIIDWKMDGLNGLECARRIRNDEDSPNKFFPDHHGHRLHRRKPGARCPGRWRE